MKDMYGLWLVASLRRAGTKSFVGNAKMQKSSSNTSITKDND